MLISNILELNNLLYNQEHIAILGTGWIAKLFWMYFSYYTKKETEIEIIKNDEDNVLAWKQTLLDSPTFDNCPLFVAAKEDKGKKICEGYRGHDPIFYFSENLKNEIDAMMMSCEPEIYEVEVLNGRKQELDSDMTKKIGTMISEIMSQDQFPLFQGIELETINRCNGTCSFCPVNKFDDPRQLIKMDENLFFSIISQLKELHYSGRVALYSNNEPFLDNRIIEFIRYSKNELPRAFVYLFTNGTLMGVDKFKSVIDYLDFLCIDLYYDSIEEITTKPILSIADYCERNNLCDKVMIQMISRKALRNNRGGISKNRTRVYQPKAPCILPFTQMIVRPDGKCSLCCNDPLGEYTLADLTKESLIDAWNNIKYRDIRSTERGIAITRQKIRKCASCDNYSTTNQNGNMIFNDTQIKNGWDAFRKIVNNS